MDWSLEASLTPPFVELDLIIVPGDNGVITVTVTDGSGNAIDLTGAAITFTVKSDLGQADPGIFQLAVGTGIVLANQTTSPGVFTITIPAVDTAPPILQPGILYQHRTRLTLSGVATTLLGGTLLLCR
jgi:hypothetical protein